MPRRFTQEPQDVAKHKHFFRASASVAGTTAFASRLKRGAKHLDYVTMVRTVIRAGVDGDLATGECVGTHVETSGAVAVLILEMKSSSVDLIPLP